MNETQTYEYRSEMTRWEALGAVGYLPFHIVILPVIYSLLVGNTDGALTKINLLVYGTGMALMLLAEGRFLRRDFDPLCDRFGLCLKTILGSYLWMMLSNYGVNDLILFGKQSIESSALANPGAAQLCALFLMTLPMTFVLIRKGVAALKSRQPKLSALIDILGMTLIFFAIETVLADIAVRSGATAVAGADNPNNGAIISMADANMGPVAGMTIFMAPVVEELIFRAGIFGALRRKNRIAAYVVTIFMFSVYHIYSYVIVDPVNWVYLLQYITISFLLCRCYEKTECIWSSIFLHMLINGISMWIISLLGSVL